MSEDVAKGAGVVSRGLKLGGVDAWLIGVALVGAVTDLVTKALSEGLRGRHPYVVIDGLFNFAYAENHGMAFSFLWGHRSLLLAVAAGALLVILWLSRSDRAAPPLYHGTLGLILGGVIGNGYDRLTLGYVRDFLDVHAEGFPALATWLEERFRTCHWPTFNLADMYILAGAALLFIMSLRSPPPAEAAQPAAATDAT